MFPTVKLTGEKLLEVIRKLKSDIKRKNLSIGDVFSKFDPNGAGLVSFGMFSENLD